MRLPARALLFRSHFDHSRRWGKWKRVSQGVAGEENIDTYLHTLYVVSYISARACMRGDRAPQVSLGPHWYNTFTDVTLHSKLLRCRTRISSPLLFPPYLPLDRLRAKRDTVVHACVNRDARVILARIRTRVSRRFPNLLARAPRRLLFLFCSYHQRRNHALAQQRGLRKIS